MDEREILSACAPKARSREALEEAVAECFYLLAQGRLAALGDLYDILGVDVFGYVRSMTGSNSDAEDVFQEVFAKIAGRGAKLARVNKPLAYVFTVARNEALSLISRRSKRRHAGEEALLFEAAPQERPIRLTPSEAQDALAKLPDEQRETVVLKIYQGFTFAEIGEITDVSANTAASRYRYGIEKLARLLKFATGDE